MMDLDYTALENRVLETHTALWDLDLPTFLQASVEAENDPEIEEDDSVTPIRQHYVPASGLPSGTLLRSGMPFVRMKCFPAAVVQIKHYLPYWIVAACVMGRSPEEMQVFASRFYAAHSLLSTYRSYQVEAALACLKKYRAHT